MTEEQRIAELMEPRYKVIADYPENPIPVGEVLSDIKNGTLRKYYKDLWKDVVKKLDKYPHLFKRLEWWEDRKPEEMPEYVKDKYNQVHKVTSVERIGANLEKGFYAHWKNVQPATLAEYQQYINSKPQP